MSERVHEHQHRPYLPAMGHRRLIGFYDLLTRLAGVPRMHRALVDRAAVEPGMDVLEIGCGTGNLALLVRRRRPTARVIGIDPDDRALGRARTKAARRRLEVTFEPHYADDLPYPDQSQDRVLSSLMFHHLDPEQKQGALAEALRVLRPGGELHLLDFSDGGAHRRRVPDRFAAGTGDRIPEALRAAGFTDVARTGTVSARFGTGRCAMFRAVKPRP